MKAVPPEKVFKQIFELLFRQKFIQLLKIVFESACSKKIYRNFSETQNL